MTHGSAAPRKRTSSKEVTNVTEDNECSNLPSPPDGGWGWVVVFASFMIHIVTDGITYSFGIFYVEFLNYFGEGKGYTACIASILVGVTLCSGPISSSFVNRYGCRAVTIAGALFGGICLIASVFAQNVLTLIITIGVGAGIGFGLIYLPAIVSVTMYFEKYRSLATGIAVCGSGFGTFIFAPVTELLIGEYGWRGAMLIISSIVLNCMLFGAMFRPLEHPKVKNTLLPDTSKIDKTSDIILVNKLKECEEESSDSTNIENNSIHIPRSQSVGLEMQEQHYHQMRQNESVKKIKSFEKNGLLAIKNNEGIRLTSSQPLLQSFVSEKLYREQAKLSRSGTMYRPDILYQGSLYNIPQYRSQGQLSINDSDRYGSLRRSIKYDDQDDVVICGCVPCSQETRDTFTEMLNWGLLRDPVFIIFTISNFFTSIGFNIPYVYLAAQAETLGLTKERASYLLSIIGIANTFGRIILGYLSDKPWVNRLLIYNVSLTIAGLSTALSVLCLDFLSLGAYASIYGFTIGAYVGLTSVILVDLLGLERLTNAFGLLLLFQGVASLVGPPIAGCLYDALESYTPGFLLAGITMAASGIILFAIPPLQRYQAKKACRCNPQLT